MTRLPGAICEVTVREEAERVRVVVTGELDLSCEPRVRGLLDDLRLDGTAVLLDLSSLSYMDSTGVRLLLNLSKAARRTGWSFAVFPAMPPLVARVLDETGARQIVPFAP